MTDLIIGGIIGLFLYPLYLIFKPEIVGAVKGFLHSDPEEDTDLKAIFVLGIVFFVIPYILHHIFFS